MDDLEKLQEADLKKSPHSRITGGVSFNKAGDLIIPGDKDKRKAIFKAITTKINKKLLTFNNYSDVLFQRQTKPKGKPSSFKMFTTKTKDFFKNFGVDIRWRMEPGPYQNQTFDALTQGTFKLAGSTFWGPQIIGPLYSKMKIPW